jgi:cell shape-determining protein MreC
MVFCLPYSVFATPLVNAIQEQQKQIEALKKQVQETADLKNRLEQLETKLMN